MLGDLSMELPFRRGCNQALLKPHVRNKDEPLVDEAELLEINPS